MWLLTAVGAVNSQNHFTFALEQNRSYTIGREKTCDIRFESRSVRQKEGTLDVGDWDPTKGNTPPVLTFKVMAKKNGAFPSYKMMTPYENAVGSMSKDEYVLDELAQQGLYFENPGQGVELGGDSWFFAQWVEMLIMYKGLEDTTRASLKRYCIPYVEAFDIRNHPTIAISDVYKSTSDLNYAVCYGIRIVTPAYLNALLAGADASWKQIVDSLDSFQLPEAASDAYRPALSSGMANVRNDVAAWLPDPSRKHLFAGWKILGLTANSRPPLEKRYMTAMGADFTELDIVTTPLLSDADFTKRIAKWVASVGEVEDRQHAVIAHFSGVKEAVQKTGVNWNRVVASTCQAHGFWLASGHICWGSVKMASVQAYLTEGSGGGPVAAAASTAQADPSTSTRRSPEKSRLPSQSRQDNAALPDPSPAPPRIPSTYPDETAALAREAAEVGPSTRTRHAVKSPEVEIPPPTATAGGTRKPLKRRAGKQTTQDLFSMDIDPAPSIDNLPPESQENALKDESIPLPSAAQRIPASQTTNVPPTQSTPPKPSRLKRRAGVASQASTFDLFADMEPASVKDEETPQEIRDLYEATRRGDHPTLKRSRVVSGESGMIADEDSQSSDAGPVSLPQQAPGRIGRVPVAQADANVGVDVEMDDGAADEEDFVQKTLRRVAASRKAGKTQTIRADAEPRPKVRTNMPPPSLPLRRGRSPSEEAEVVESAKRPRHASPEKPKKGPKGKPASRDTEEVEEEVEKTNEPTTDPAFLLAVSKSRSKKAIDEMDKEFNNLRIPKAAIKGKQAQMQQQQQEAENMDIPPDYGILNDFGDEMRGNFIQVIRKDLFRKDGGAKQAQRVEDGRPNFKKFKKKEILRRDPIPLVLVGRNTDEEEMGAPYWPEATGGNGQMTLQSQTLNGDDANDLPLLPRPRNRRLLAEDGEEDEVVPLSLASTNRRRGATTATATDTQSGPASTAQPRGGRLSTRATSIISEADSAVSSSTRGTRSGRAAAAPAKTAGKGRKQATVLEDSDEEEEGVKFTPSNSGGRTGSGVLPSRSGATTSSRGWKTAASDDLPLPTATGASARLGRSTGQPSSSVTVGRRKLLSLDEDDDAGMDFTAAAKKRRTG